MMSCLLCHHKGLVMSNFYGVVNGNVSNIEGNSTINYNAKVAEIITENSVNNSK